MKYMEFRDIFGEIGKHREVVSLVAGWFNHDPEFTEPGWEVTLTRNLDQSYWSFSEYKDFEDHFNAFKDASNIGVGINVEDQVPYAPNIPANIKWLAIGPILIMLEGMHPVWSFDSLFRHTTMDIY